MAHGDTRNPKARQMTDSAERPLSDAARRALAEAEERRRILPPQLPAEFGGRDGPEPVRYGDWEKKGLAVDF
jgi:hypothetical protein